MNKGIFKLAGAEWKIVFVDGFGGDGFRWKRDYPMHTITAYTSHEGELTSRSRVMRNVWDAISFCIIIGTMHEGEDMRDYVSGFSLLIHQVYETLHTKIYDGSAEGHFTIGGAHFNIVEDNVVCMKDGIDGRMNPNTSKVTLKTKDLNSGSLYKKEFIEQTMWHEIVHAINSELGYSPDSKQDKEGFVNTLSSFLFEVTSTLNITYNQYNGADQKATEVK